MPYFLNRLLLTALATSIAACAFVPEANAAVPGTITYVLEGLDGPDLPTAPGLSAARVDLIDSASPPIASVATNCAATPLVILSAALLPMPTAARTELEMATGSLLPGDSAESEATALQRAAVDANGELLPIDPEQEPIVAAATVPGADAPFPRVRPAVLSLLDGPGPLPALRPIPGMVSASEVNFGGKPSIGEQTVVGDGNPPGDVSATAAHANIAAVRPGHASFE